MTMTRFLATTALSVLPACAVLPALAAGPAESALLKSLSCIEASDAQYNAVLSLDVAAATQAAQLLDRQRRCAGRCTASP